ncbi:MAG: F420-0:Gamma-glutamyl ligase [Acidimicrobiia bacterium]|nr:F420-0:Gamma-glutamyl ligase [Acidimicrobiia bacterium]
MGIARRAATVLGTAAAAVGAVELLHRRAPGNDVAFSDEGFRPQRMAAGLLRLSGRVTVENLTADREVMLCGVEPHVALLSDASVAELRTACRVESRDKAYPPRPDGYWTAYVVKPAGSSAFDVQVDVQGRAAALDALYAVWVDVRVGTYGAEGPRPRSHHVFVALREAERTPPSWRDVDGAQVLPVRTHLLTPDDDPLAVVQKYAAPQAEPGDVVVIGESPLAVMQGRLRHPDEVRVGWFASRFCSFMGGEGSLGTGPGLQVLVDQVGGPRVLGALAAGAPLKLAGRPGWFYRLAGDQARLVDDVTGSLPPYDQFIVLGPERSDSVCEAIERTTGLGAAVCDANDLGRVDVLGASTGVDHAFVRRALASNPAGNGAETTPLVLVRPPAP